MRSSTASLQATRLLSMLSTEWKVLRPMCPPWLILDADWNFIYSVCTNAFLSSPQLYLEAPVSLMRGYSLPGFKQLRPGHDSSDTSLPPWNDRRSLRFAHTWISSMHICPTLVYNADDAQVRTRLTPNQLRHIQPITYTNDEWPTHRVHEACVLMLIPYPCISALVF